MVGSFGLRDRELIGLLVFTFARIGGSRHDRGLKHTAPIIIRFSNLILFARGYHIPDYR